MDRECKNKWKDLDIGQRYRQELRRKMELGKCWRGWEWQEYEKLKAMGKSAEQPEVGALYTQVSNRDMLPSWMLV